MCWARQRCLLRRLRLDKLPAASHPAALLRASVSAPLALFAAVPATAPSVPAAAAAAAAAALRKPLRQPGIGSPPGSVLSAAAARSQAVSDSLAAEMRGAKARLSSEDDALAARLAALQQRAAAAAVEAV